MDESDVEKLVIRIAAEFGITDRRTIIAGPDGWRLHRLHLMLDEAFLAGEAEGEERAAVRAARERGELWATQ